MTNLGCSRLSLSSASFRVSRAPDGEFAASKQMRRALQFAISRPFSWIGSTLDSLETAKVGSSRVVTQFTLSLVNGDAIRLAGGGRRARRCAYLDDCMDCLTKIVESWERVCDGEIFNVGDSDGECTIAEPAGLLGGRSLSLLKTPATWRRRT